jgi:hypothetical protein
MNLKNRIVEIRSKKDIIILASEIDKNPELLVGLMAILEERKTKQSMYGSWVLCQLAENSPELVSPFSHQILSLFKNSPHTGANRNLMRCLMEIDVSEDIMSPLIDQCIEFINDPNQPVAVKAFSIQSFAQIVLKMPDLAIELKLAIAHIHLLNSPALQSASRKVKLMMKKNRIPF